jgi:hypothetical protein
MDRSRETATNPVSFAHVLFNALGHSRRDTKKPEHGFRLPGSFVVSWSLESNRDLFAGIRWAAGNLLHPLHLLLLFAG